jgi:uncharacterized membrane protein (UPF0136 family)
MMSVTARSFPATYFGALTVLLSVVGAAAFLLAAGDLSFRVLGFALWSLPLAFVITRFSSGRRFESSHPALRALFSAGFGASAGAGVAILSLMLTSGAMLAWGFPVLYPWTFAGACAALASTFFDQQRSIPRRYAVGALAVVIAPLTLLAWRSQQPVPAIRITFGKDPLRDAATYVLDSLVVSADRAKPGLGNAWRTQLWRRWDADGDTTEVLIVTVRAEDRDSIRLALRRYPYVIKVIDTLVSPESSD